LPPCLDVTLGRVDYDAIQIKDERDTRLHLYMNYLTVRPALSL
jgi:hypothetical protein